MASTKATELAAFARAKGYGCTRFDYSGHGVSSGRFEDGTIGAWLDEAEAVFRRVTRGPQIVIGSSMGGYIALLLLRRLLSDGARGGRAHRRARAHRAGVGHDRRADVEAVRPQGAPRAAETGVYPAAVRIRRALRHHAGADRGGPQPPPGDAAVRSGAAGGHPAGRVDTAVPIAHTRELLGFLPGGWVVLHEIADGEHRLSRPQDLALLFAAIEQLADRAGPLPPQ